MRESGGSMPRVEMEDFASAYAQADALLEASRSGCGYRG